MLPWQALASLFDDLLDSTAIEAVWRIAIKLPYRDTKSKICCLTHFYFLDRDTFMIGIMPIDRSHRQQDNLQQVKPEPIGGQQPPKPQPLDKPDRAITYYFR